MQQQWRSAGISYLRYTNINAVLTRRALKEPFATAAKERNATNMRVSVWERGSGKIIQSKIPVLTADELVDPEFHNELNP